MPRSHKWSRPEAERKPKELLDAAKGTKQEVHDFDGHFEVTFRPAHTGKTVADILAEGNPLSPGYKWRDDDRN